MRQPGEPSVEEILDSIKKVIARDSREVRAAPAPAVAAHAADDVLDLAVSARFLDPVEEAPATAPTEDPLLTDGARASMRESLAALALLAQPSAAPQIVRAGETSLEGLVRDLLRPALTQWLDTHLPAIVERLVAAEISRIVGKRG